MTLSYLITENRRRLKDMMHIPSSAAALTICDAGDCFACSGTEVIAGSSVATAAVLTVTLLLTADSLAASAIALPSLAPLLCLPLREDDRETADIVSQCTDAELSLV